MNYQLEKLCAYELGEMVNNHLITPTEVIKYFEDRILKYNKDINALKG